VRASPLCGCLTVYTHINIFWRFVGYKVHRLFWFHYKGFVVARLPHLDVGCSPRLPLFIVRFLPFGLVAFVFAYARSFVRSFTRLPLPIHARFILRTRFTLRILPVHGCSLRCHALAHPLSGWVPPRHFLIPHVASRCGYGFTFTAHTRSFLVTHVRYHYAVRFRLTVPACVYPAVTSRATLALTYTFTGFLQQFEQFVWLPGLYSHKASAWLVASGHSFKVFAHRFRCTLPFAHRAVIHYALRTPPRLLFWLHLALRFAVRLPPCRIPTHGFATPRFTAHYTRFIPRVRTVCPHFLAFVNSFAYTALQFSCCALPLAVRFLLFSFNVQLHKFP